MLAGGGLLLLEREPELERLRTLLRTVAAGSGAVVVITGPPGIGKTQLARALREEAEADGCRVLCARGAEFEHEYGFGVVRQWFEPLVRAGDPDAMLHDAALLAAPVLAARPGRGDDPSYSVLHGLYWLAAGLAASRPLVLVLDDAQWSDEASLRFSAFLARRLDGLPALLALTTRDPGAGLVAELASDPAAEQLRLLPLGPRAVSDFLREHAGHEVEDAFAAACHEATGGNPFLLAELTQTLTDEGVEFVAAERGRVRAVGPRSVATWVQLRLARLPSAATRLARAAAVAGDDVPLGFVRALARLPEGAAEAAADDLTRSGILDGSRPLRFTHPIVGAAIRESLLPGERQALHARAAKLLAASGAPAQAVSVHLLPLEPAGNAEVAATLAHAARHATAQGAPEAAAVLLQRALAEPPHVDEVAPLLLALGEAEHALERPASVEHLREAHRLARDPRDRGRAALLLTWAVVSGTTEPRDVSELLEQGSTELAAADPDLALRLDAAWMEVAWDQGRLDDVLARGGRHVHLAGRTPGECLVLAHLAHAWLDDGRPAAEVAPLAERAANLELVRELEQNSIWLIHTGTALRTAERLETARRLTTRAVEEAQRAGSLRAFLLASMYRAAVLNRAGAVAEAEADARAALAAGARELVFLPAVAMLVESLVEQGRANDAARLLERHHLTDALPEFRHGTVLLFSRAMLRAEQGNHAGALADLLEARTRLDRSGRLNVVGLDGRVRAALLQRALGRREEAEQEALLAVAVARRWATPGAVGTALRALALVRGDVELLREAVTSLAESPLGLEHARALVDLGASLRRAGSRADSRPPLRQALALADECGGVAVREHAREELAASGIHVRRRTLTGAAALTPSERRIAERAASGASNPEIAQALFVTVKTVEMHLSSAYRKLGISRRTELAGALGAPGAAD
jgi:DNA-binding CsgD family transcriptional regulator